MNKTNYTCPNCDETLYTITGDNDFFYCLNLSRHYQDEIKEDQDKAIVIVSIDK